ncbi:MAG: PGF-pre-PGF domain-containing protein [Candidatus Hadarchaeales archaeon]
MRREMISLAVSTLLLLSIVGSVGAPEQQLSGSATVTSAADFYIVISPSATSVNRGENVKVTVYVYAIGGFSGTVTLSAPDAPSRIEVSFVPQSGTPDFSSTFELRVTPFQPAGVYNITVRGVSGALTRENTLTLTVNQENNVESFSEHTISNIPPGGSATIFPTGVRIENVTIYMQEGQGATNVGIKVADLMERNSWLPPLPVKEYKYVYIDKENIDHIDRVEITFTVEKSWLQTNNLTPYSIILFRWETNKWVPRPTTLIGDTGTAYRYRAIWPGLSNGGIGGDNNPPSVPVLTSPENGKTVTSPVTLDWQDSIDNEGYVQRYHVQVDNDPDFSSPEVDENTPDNTSSYQVVLTPGTYYWRVRAQDNAGNWSDWSASRYFVVTVAPPGAYDIEHAQLMATIGVIIDIVIEGDIDWGTVSVNAHNVTPPAPVDNYWIRILETTTVSVDLYAKAENDAVPENIPGMYLAKSGGDNNIENIQFWKLPIGESGNENFLVARTVLEKIPWLVNLRKPPVGISYDEYNVFPALSTAPDQLGGIYYGRLTIKAVESS